MTLTIKDSPEMNNPGKSGTPSQNAEKKGGESPRSNPVCLEVGVTIRSLPTEAGGVTKPIREEGRTVIVFDNGAVLRSTNNLPLGQTVILSNANGRDVVCRVVGGRNLPSVKGYVEVEFIEPVSDFWGIHQDASAVAVAPPRAAPPAPRQAPAPLPFALPRASASQESPAKPASASLGGGPSFDDIDGLVNMILPPVARQPKTEPGRPGPEPMAKEVSGYNLSGIAESTSVANWRPQAPELPEDPRASLEINESSSLSSVNVAPSRDFMSKGLMAYEQPPSSASASRGRMPLIMGAAVVLLAGISGGIFLMHRTTAPVEVANAVVVGQPSAPAPPTAKSASEAASAPLGAAAPSATEPQAQAAGQSQVQTPSQAQPLAVNEPQPAAALAPVPAVVTNSITTELSTESNNSKRSGKKAAAAKQPDLPASRRPAIPNLKMGSPNAPNQNQANATDGTAPMTEIAATEAVGGSSSAALLTSAGRTSNPPAPPSAPAPVVAAKVVREPKLISSTRLVYPTAAKQSNIQGTVTVAAHIDANGKVVSAAALNGPLLLRQAAVEAVQQWKYSPGTVDGKPSPSQTTVGVEFKLN